MKICTDCRLHSAVQGLSPISRYTPAATMTYHRCSRMARISRIDGRTYHFILCKDERSQPSWWERRFGHTRCGPDGRYFERQPVSTPPTMGGSGVTSKGSEP